MTEFSDGVRHERKGSGHQYSVASRLHAAGLQPAIALFEAAAAAVPLPTAPQPIAIADYGAGTGYSALLPIGAAIAVLRKRTRADHAILVAHTDRPGNNFTKLFSTLAEDPDSYLKKDTQTFPSAVGRSFYSQILPSSSIALGWSSWAIQWLSRQPAAVPDHVHISYSTDDSARRAFDRQAALDWHEFVAYRGRELAPGGRLVVLTMGLDSDDRIGMAPAFEAVVTTIHEMVGRGLVSAEEFGRMTLPTVGRTEKDFRAPFAPSGRFEGLSIEHFEAFNAEDRFFVRYRADRDAEAFGANWAAFLRVSMFRPLVRALNPGTDRSRAGWFVDELEAAVSRRLAKAPEEMSIPQVKLALVKRRDPA